MKRIAIILLTLFVGISCKDNDDVKPAETGTYLVYTNKAADKFDQIEVKLNGELVGTLTKPYLTTLQRSTPDCDSQSSGAVVRIERPVGSYSLDAVAYLKGKAVGKWSDAIRIDAGMCGKSKLNSNN